MDYSQKKSLRSSLRVTSLVIAGIIILVNILSLRYYFRWDLTDKGLFSLSDSSAKIISELDDIVRVKFYVSEEIPDSFKIPKQSIIDLLKEYESVPNALFEYDLVDPKDDEDLQLEAAQIGINPVNMQTGSTNSLEITNGYFGMAVFYQGEKTVFPALDPQKMNSFEYELTSAILKLSSTEQKTIAFLQGHGERSLQADPNQPQLRDHYQEVNEYLQREHTVTTIDFSKNNSLSGVDVLIVAGNKRNLTDRALFEIEQYLLKGGKALFLVDALNNPYETVVEVQETNIMQFLEPAGVTISPNLLLDTSAQSIFANLNQTQTIINYPPFIIFQKQFFGSENPIINGIDRFGLRFVSQVSVNPIEGLSYDEFVKTSPASWVQYSPFKTGIEALNPPEDQERQQYTVAVSLRGKLPKLTTFSSPPEIQEWVETETGEYELQKSEAQIEYTQEVLQEAQEEAHVVVITDSDFISSENLQGGGSGAVLFANTLDFLSSAEDLISIRSKSIQGAAIYPLEDSQKLLYRILGIVLVPILVAFYGVVRLYRRSKS